jgi:hypothetical protein
MARIMIHSGTPLLPSALVHCTAVVTWEASQVKLLRTHKFFLPYNWPLLDTGSSPTSHFSFGAKSIPNLKV